MSSTQSGLTSNTGTTSSSVAGIPDNTTTANPNSSSANNNSASYEGTGTSQYGNNVERTDKPAVSGSSGVGDKIKGVAAGIHGVGEKIRGTFNSGVDQAFHEDSGVAKNDAIAASGDSEMTSGKFAASTANREGAVPNADHGARHSQANADLNRE